MLRCSRSDNSDEIHSNSPWFCQIVHIDVILQCSCFPFIRTIRWQHFSASCNFDEWIYVGDAVCMCEWVRRALGTIPSTSVTIYATTSELLLSITHRNIVITFYSCKHTRARAVSLTTFHNIVVVCVYALHDSAEISFLLWVSFYFVLLWMLLSLWYKLNAVWLIRFPVLFCVFAKDQLSDAVWPYLKTRDTVQCFALICRSLIYDSIR